MMTSPNPGQEKKEKKKKEYDQKHFLPVTIRQVMGCTTEPPTIDGTEIYYVKIVGCIKSKDEQSTAINYAIEDGTGIIDAKEWVNDKDGASAAARREKIVSNVYVRAFGMIRTFNGTTSLQCYHISMLADVNEMTSHYLETILTHEKVSHIYFYIPIFLYFYIPALRQTLSHSLSLSPSPNPSQSTSEHQPSPPTEQCRLVRPVRLVGRQGRKHFDERQQRRGHQPRRLQQCCFGLHQEHG